MTEPGRPRIIQVLIALKPWPLLAAGIVTLAGAVALLRGTGQEPLLGIAFAVLGSVCFGAWIALLAAYGYTGKD